MITELICASILAVSVPNTQAPQVKVVNNWTVQVSAGSVKVGTRNVKISKPVKIDIAPAQLIEVKDERYDSLPVFNPETAGWIKGAPLRGVLAIECTATDLFIPESLVVKSAEDDTVYKLGTDYDIDPKWATIGRLESGSIPAGKPVLIDYKYGISRLDAVTVNKQGKITLLQGIPHVATPKAPKAAPDSVAIANIWVPGLLQKLTKDNLYPIIEATYPEPKKTAKTVAERLLPKTWEKLKNNETVDILAWGDSVTNGGQASDVQHQYQNRFADMLRAKYPKAEINLTTCAWGGRASANFMTEPSGSPYNFTEKVLGPRPDLIVMEFVNDAYLSPEDIEKNYSALKKQFDEIGAEWIIITPHFVRPDWMGEASVRVETDKRTYTKAVREFTKKHKVALADASLRWGHLLKEGIPYTTLLSNAINHPDDHGHEMFALSLMELFGGK